MRRLNPAALHRAARHSFEAHQLYVAAVELRGTAETLVDTGDEEMAQHLRAYADHLDRRRKTLMRQTSGE